FACGRSPRRSRRGSRDRLARVRVRQGKRGAPRGDEEGRPRRARRARSRRAVGQGADRGDGALGRPSLRQSAFPAPARRAADRAGGVMSTLVSTDPKPRRRRKRGGDRWVSEVKGILALLAAGFGLVALATFDPSLTPGDQQGPTGPVGAWLGWASFQSFGYASLLLPVLLGAWGASAFLRPVVVRGWAPFGGLAMLLVSAAGLLTQATSVKNGSIGGGLVGHATTGLLHSGFGNVGTWLALVAAVPIGVLCVTRVSYAAVLRVTSGRVTRVKGRRRLPAGARRPAGGAAAAGGLAGGPARVAVVEPEVFTPPVVVEPSRPRGRLAEQGLAWQETFDFGGGGAAAFQLPPVGLLKVPPATELKRTREELQENAETIRKK